MRNVACVWKAQVFGFALAAGVGGEGSERGKAEHLQLPLGSTTGAFIEHLILSQVVYVD